MRLLKAPRITTRCWEPWDAGAPGRQLFGDMDLAARCGGKEESMRMQWIIDTYSLVRDKDTNAAIKTFVKPFGADGSRKIWRAQCNQRRQRATTGKYKKSVLARGIVPGVRGDAFFTLSPELRTLRRGDLRFPHGQLLPGGSGQA